MSLKQYFSSFILITCSLVLAAPVLAATPPPSRMLKIVGGQIALANQWPWMVALVRNSEGANNYTGQFCGGSLVSPTWVVTAAHCLEQMKTTDVHIVTHTLDLKSSAGQNFSIKRIIRHPKFNSQTISNDIALLQLHKPVNKITVLPLVSGSVLWTNAKAAVIGWGALSEQDSQFSIYPPQLYNATVPVISNSVCQKAYDQYQIFNTMLCAGPADGSKDTCNGDSGGPLVVKQNNQWRLAGITSWGNGCATSGYYGVYTRVSKFISFINNAIKMYNLR